MNCTKYSIWLALVLVCGWVFNAGTAHAAEMEKDLFYIRANQIVHDNATMSARARAMGGSYAAVVNGASSMYENPAGLGAQTDHEVITGLGIDEVDEDGGYGTIITVNAGGSVNLNKAAPQYWPQNYRFNHTVGFAYQFEYVEFDDLDSLDSDMNSYLLAYGRSFFEGRVFGGASLTYSQGNIADHYSYERDWWRWEGKLGGIARLGECLAVGMTVTYGVGDTRDNASLEGDGDTYHFEFRAGAAYEYDAQTLFAADFSWSKLDMRMEDPPNIRDQHQYYRLSAGVEHALMPERLTVRGGLYYWHNNFNGKSLGVSDRADDYTGFTLGASYFPTDTIDLSYSMDARTTGELGHMFQLEFDW